jgi:acyl-CoA thioester hydrolase
MSEFKRSIQIRWSDLDPNVHIKHSVYYDWGAFCRMEMFYEYGLTMEVMQQLHFGPILFREECIFRREIRMGDVIDIDLHIVKAKQDFSRWTLKHRIMKEGQVCAEITVDGAWINMHLRKLTSPPPIVMEVFEKIPKEKAFEWI